MIRIMKIFSKDGKLFSEANKMTSNNEKNKDQKKEIGNK